MRKLIAFAVLALLVSLVVLDRRPVAAATCSVPSGSYPTIQSAVNDPTCSTINVAAGGYVENVTIARTLTLNGAQAGVPVSGRVFPSPLESTVTGMITIGSPTVAPNVTIDGFSLTNPGQSTGILVKTSGDNALITNNIIDTIGGSAFALNTQAIYLELGPDGVRVVGNKISRVEGLPTSNGGIFIGDSTSSNPSLNTLLVGNSISEIHSVNRGAYGIHVNNGASTAASATGYTEVTIRNNTITNLIGGGWAHAIGLEGDTPVAVVENNSISNLVDLTPTLGVQDAVGVWFEDNPSFSLGEVHQNNLDVTNVDFGIAVQPTLSGLPVDGTCNWWGAADGPGPGPGSVGTGTTGAKVSAKVDYTPWLIAPAPGGPCIGGLASTPGKVTGGGQVDGQDPLFSPLGDLISLPALVINTNGGFQANFGFVIQFRSGDTAPKGNLVYNDHDGTRIKATSYDKLVISNGLCGVNTHATFTGRANVNGADESLIVGVDDCGEPSSGPPPDTFSIQTDSYANSGPLVGGNIQIHK